MSFKSIINYKLNRIKFMICMFFVFFGGNRMLQMHFEEATSQQLQDGADVINSISAVSSDVMPMTIALYLIGFFVIKLRCNHLGYGWKQFALSCFGYVIPLANIMVLVYFSIIPGKEARDKAAKALREKMKQAEEAKKAEEKAANEEQSVKTEKEEKADEVIETDYVTNENIEGAAAESKVILEKKPVKKNGKKNKKAKK